MMQYGPSPKLLFSQRKETVLQHVCHVGFYQFISVFLHIFSQNGILLLKLGILFLKKRFIFESANAFSTPKQKSHYSKLLMVLLAAVAHWRSLCFCVCMEENVTTVSIVWNLYFWFDDFTGQFAKAGWDKQSLKICLWIFLHFFLMLKLQQLFSFCIFLNLVLDFRAVVTSEELKNSPDVLFKGCVFLDHSTLFYCATKLTLFQFICISEDCV